MKDNSISKWSTIHPDLDFSKSEQNNSAYISLPIIDQSTNYAMFYVETRYSGDLVIYKRESEKSWQFYAIGNIWIE